MKIIKYYFSLLCSLLGIFIIPLGVIMCFYSTDMIYVLIGIVLTSIGFITIKPFREFRVRSRQNVEYDEFGRSKSKGRYEYLSKKERDEIDLQKTLDMERIVDSTALKKITKKGSLDPEKDMEKLVGLSPIKLKMTEMVARMKFELENNKENIAGSMNSISGRHMVFYGNPGTGKTTVARILTGFLYKFGYIKENKCIEVDGNFLKAGADTAVKTELVIREAFNGVLFIDEAYALMDGSYGADAIATLIKQMEDNRDKFILILAGYTNEMIELLKTNPGFESRIKEYLDFPDYTNEDLFEIFKRMAKEQNFDVNFSCITPLMQRLNNERVMSSFGNGRTVRNILDESIDKHALNYTMGKLDETDKFVLRDIDINTQIKKTNIW